ncbi:hypothetical protein ACW4YW_04725 [Methylobacillus pratensis]
MDNWLQKISKFFKDLFGEAFTALFDLLKDILLWLFDNVLTGVGDLLELIPDPCCVPVNWVGDLIGRLPPFAIYVVSQIDFKSALAIIACGVAFRLARKLFTLFQW